MKKYEDYKQLAPFGTKATAFLDLDLLDQNILDLNQALLNMPVRLATKSIRSIDLQKKLIPKFKNFKGWMTFSLEETNHLAELGFDHLLLAYPSLDKFELEKMIPHLKDKKDIVLTLDHPDHLHFMESFGQKHNILIPICLDIDVASHWSGFTFGVHRSSIHHINDFKQRLELLKKCPHLKLVGLLAYEAQLAGVPDYKMNPHFAIKLLKQKSLTEIKKKRKEILNLALEFTKTDLFFNGGGSGSVLETSSDDSINEITIGSALYSPHLFDYYDHFKYAPALFYSVPITRNPQKDIWTCHGGGFIASGSTHSLKQPIPYLPHGGELLKNEGAGEVQTPIKYKGSDKINLGDPYFFRSAKAGEVLEHFNDLSLVRNNQIEQVIKTYRGDGLNF